MGRYRWFVLLLALAWLEAGSGLPLAAQQREVTTDEAIPPALTHYKGREIA
jgi:hypothetical protein